MEGVMAVQDVAIQEHQQKLMEAFAEVLKAEDAVSVAKTKLDEATTLLGLEKSKAEHALGQAWQQVQQLMAETGEVEVLLPGSVTDYKIGYSKPPERVKVEPDAVPDEFCRVERKPRLKEIGDYLKGLRETGQPLPNWGGFEHGEPKLTWKAVKRNNKGS
jgi:hypothetical protein